MSKNLDVLICTQVEEILDDNSGGIKYLELLVLMTEWAYSVSGVTSVEVEYLEKNLERIIEESNNMKILKYTMRRQHREKMFVYFH